MNDTLICDELCELDLDVRSTDEFFEVMSKKAVDLGYVTEQFLSAIKKKGTGLSYRIAGKALSGCNTAFRSHQHREAVYCTCSFEKCNQLV